MSSYQELSAMLERVISKVSARTWFFQGKVISVDKDKYTCDVLPIGSDAKFLDVRLRATNTEGESGLVLFPQVDSLVLIARMDDTEGFVLQAEKIESIVCYVSDQFKYKIDAQGNFIINDGNNGGLIIIQKLQEQINKNSAILDAMKVILTGAPINEVGGGSPSVLQQTLGAVLQGKTTADLSSITNDKIKH